MKRIFIIQFVAILSFSCRDVYCQQVQHQKAYTCTEMLNHLSYFWKLDSLANNGLRLFTYDKLLTSKIDSVTKESLFDKLGKPNRIWQEQHGVVYVYHTWDVSKMPKDYDAPLTCTYIAFIFNDRSKYLQSMREGDIDL